MHEILTSDQMREADRLTVNAGADSFNLMTAAGDAVARAVMDRFPSRGSVLVLCGPGNNGGDGFVAARILRSNGYNVRIASLVPLTELKGDAARAASAWTGHVFPFAGLQIASDEIIIDAVFGAGFRSRIESPVLDVFDIVRHQGNPVVAVDIPSGIDGNTGNAVIGTPRAVLTVTFFRKKLGHVVMPGLDLCGDVIVADIGIPFGVLRQTGIAAYENTPDLWRARLLPKTLAGNKYDYGHAVIYGGRHMTGAASLAAHAAMRAGAGLCTIAAHPWAQDVYRAYNPAILVESCSRPSYFSQNYEDSRRNAVLIGPGAGIDHGKNLRQALIDLCASQKPCVLDADALSVFEGQEKELHAALHDKCILTPHEGEFARVFPGLNGTKIARVQEAVRLSGATILLKGADTVICAPDGRVAVNVNGPADLATGGSGDVLAGLILGLLARGMTAFDAACAGAWMQGRAAQMHGVGLMASDLPDLIPAVLREIA